MKSNFLMLPLYFMTAVLCEAQNPHLEVEGHAKIRGNIDIHHMDDSTSLFIGKNAGINMNFSNVRRNTFVGSGAGVSNTTNGFNSFFGYFAGNNSSGSFNSFFGARSGENNGGSFNSFFGSGAGSRNTSGSFNSFFGLDAGQNNISGESNTFLGHNAGQNSEDGHNNTFVGKSAGAFNVSGGENTFFGTKAGANNTIGSFNTAIGFETGLTNRAGTRNTFIGADAGLVNADDTLDRAIAIGHLARVACSNCAVIGGSGQEAVNVGIGTASPKAPLDVRGNTQIRGRIDINQAADSTSVFVGRNAGIEMSFQFQRNSTIMGSNAGRTNQSGADNSFFGSRAGGLTTAEGNSFFGSSSGFNNTSGYENSFFGYESGVENEGGSRNAYFGFQSGKNFSAGSNNTFLGQQSGFNGSGSHNTFLGAQAGRHSDVDSLDRAIAIGKGAKVGCSNCAVIGGSGLDSVKVGIGVSIPVQALDVNGGARFRKVGNLPPFSQGATAVYMYSDGTLVLNSSDLRLKEHIEPIGNVLKKLQNISGYTYNYKSSSEKFSEIGVIAQELETEFPELVFTNKETGYRGVHYEKISAILIQAIKEQQQQIEKIQRQLDAFQDSKSSKPHVTVPDGSTVDQ